MADIPATTRPIVGRRARRLLAVVAPVVALAAVLGVVVAAGGGSPPPASASPVATTTGSAATAMIDVAALLDARSPGARAAGALLQSKVARGFLPVEPVALVGDPPFAFVPFVPGAPDLALPVDPLATGPIGDAGPTPAIVGAYPGILPGVGGFVGTPGVVAPPGPGGPPSATPPSDTPPPPVAAVPEPSTWAMTILGFGLVGGALRRRRRGAVLPA